MAGYEDCCRRNASDQSVEFCPVCGHALVRCLAFAECRGLVNQAGACEQCVRPILLMATSGVQTKKGERVSIPLVLRNDSNNRALLVKRIARLDEKSDLPLRLTWQQIEPGGERHFSLDTAALEVGGMYTFSVMLVLSIVIDGIEESFAVQGSVSLRAESQDAQNVSTTITINGDISGHPLVNAQTNVRPQSGSAASKQLEPVPLQRGDSYELDNGVRGYQQEAYRVPRTVALAFNGFAAREAPQSGRILAARGRLTVGRNSQRAKQPNDLCIRVYKSNGDIDEPATMAISEHHFDVIVANDRLYIQSHARSGIKVNSELLNSGETLELKSGDRLVALPERPEALALQFTFSRKHNAVERVTVTRTPATK